MHIALFTDFHPATLGGVQTAMRALTSGLRGLGHRVTVFCPPAPHPVADDPDLVLLRPVPRATLAGGLPMVLPTRANRYAVDAAFATRARVDLVHALTTYGCGILGARAARRHGIPVVQTMQSRDDTVIERYAPSPLSAALTMRLLHGWFVPLRGATTDVGDDLVARLAWRPLIAQARAADHVTVPTEHFARRLRARGVDRPIHVVSNGIDDALLDTVLDAGPARADECPPEDEAESRTAATGAGRGSAEEPAAARDGTARTPLRVLWCGRLSPEKRPVAAVEVVRGVADCTLSVYGDGRLADDLRAAVAVAGVGDRVRLHGEVDQAEILRAMRAHDVLLLTSDCDTQGMVLLEAVATELPVVYCDPELAETVPEAGGLRAADSSVQALAAALRALAGDRARLPAMRRALAERSADSRQSRHLARLVAVYTAALADAERPCRRSSRRRPADR
ncbi:MAG TPA: glycosyltransferase [Nocardia sp.]|uniref:glycosyltransferase n=1 Tax=Nocardia sp. TaxID=1821 RepID=UPI002B4B1945|nr:glycosyltransferase [Nocardia sp.]HLS75782.1 glycosyltransferase [Nocardia sp.]